MEAAIAISYPLVEKSPTPLLIGWIRDQAEHYGKLVSNYRAVGIVPPIQPQARVAVSGRHKCRPMAGPREFDSIGQNSRGRESNPDGLWGHGILSAVASRVSLRLPHRTSRFPNESVHYALATLSHCCARP